MSEELEKAKQIVEKVLKMYPTAKPRPVQNFLLTSTGYSYLHQLANLDYDAELYNWDPPTINAIRMGLKLMLKEGLVK
jgi:hypothetical protein